MQQALSKAISLLENAVTEYGIVASTIEADNYKRVWARDSVVAGVAGILLNNEKIIEGLKRTVITLSNYQHELGIIPSNVLVKKDGADRSFGSIAGRVDATCWYIVGACLFLKKYPDYEKKYWLKEHIDKALLTLSYWEFNAKGLLYLPTSGNWADEYPVKGHTLYDNLLRLWGMRLYQSIFGNKEAVERLNFIEEKIKINFWPEKININSKQVYHPRLFENATEKRLNHWLCYLAPEGFNTTFDAAGNALALLLDIGNEEKTETLCHYLSSIFSYLGKSVVLHFGPITTTAMKIGLPSPITTVLILKAILIIFTMGDLASVDGINCDGLGRYHGKRDLAERILIDYLKIETPENIGFYEYISANEMKPGGKMPLCYSASGLIFMLKALENNSATELGFSGK
ncbi:MAG: hypothetical protein R2788_21520 [Saprospiraceae bacterium]